MATTFQDVPGAETDALLTIRDMIRYAITTMTGRGVFFGHGFPDARAEAAYLVCWKLGLPLDNLPEFLDARLTRSEREGLFALLHDRVDRRIPAPYITGEAWLGDHVFAVDERVLIPRSFIADLLHDGLTPWVTDPDGVSAVLDLCTGSGCLAILAALAFPHARVDAVDISADALDVARRNVEAYGLDDRVRLVESDLFARIHDRRYDVILSNPPYVNADSMAGLPEEYRREPALALDGGTDGLDIVRQVLAQAKIHLNAGGILVVETGHEKPALEQAYPDLDFIWVSTHAGDDYVFLLNSDQLPDTPG